MPVNPARVRAILVRCVLLGAIAGIAPGLAACGAGGASGGAMERADSAGVEIIMNRGADVPLDWRFEATLALGGADDGPDAFFGLGTGTVAVDADGRLHVLDRGNYRVVVFDSTGEHLRTFGGQGGGPGEFEWPATIAVAPDGTVLVWAFEKRAYVRFGPDGRVLPERAVELSVEQMTPFALVGPALALKVRDASAEDRRFERLVTLGPDDDTTVVASLEQPPLEFRDFGCVGITMPPLFTPSLEWSTHDGRFMVIRGVDYAVDVFDAHGRIASIRRDLEPRPVTDALALEEAGDGMTVRFGGGGGCEVPPEKVVEGRGYQQRVPLIDRLAVAPDGTIWVRRRVVGDRPPPIDLFDADGAYRGTLPAGSPFPVAFMPDGRLVSIESDELDVQRIVVYRAGPGGLATDAGRQ